MFPQKTSHLGQWIAGVAVAIYAVNNPTSAAHLVNKVIAAIGQFASALG
jgi:hypothetical protein